MNDDGWLSRAGKGSLLADKAVRWAVSRVFYTATSEEQLDGYMNMEPKDIAAPLCGGVTGRCKYS